MKIDARFAYEVGLEPMAVLHRDNSVLEALGLISALEVQGLPVCNSEGQVEGFVSLSDIAGRIPPSQEILRKHNIPTKALDWTLRVEAVMTPMVITADYNEDIIVITDMLTRRHTIESKDRSRKQHITSIPLLQHNRVSQILSYVELLQRIDTEETLIGSITTPKRIPSVYPDDPLKVANASMEQTGQRFALVIDDSQFPIGILSDINLLRYIRDPYQLFDLPVSAAMTDLSYLTTISPDDRVDKVIPLFVNFRSTLKAFPVLDGAGLFGVITYLDILNGLMGNYASKSG